MGLAGHQVEAEVLLTKRESGAESDLFSHAGFLDCRLNSLIENSI
jgi:hypothetical protein